MDLMHRTSSASAVDASLDSVARTLGRRLPRRQMFGLLAATLATGALGTAVATDAAAKGKSNHKASLDSKKKGGKKGGKGGGGTTTTTPAPVQQPQPPQLPDASQNCRAAGNQCGTNAGVQGACRVAAAADNQAGFICTSNQAGNACTASTQCGAGTRCVIQGAAQTCRVVIA